MDPQNTYNYYYVVNNVNYFYPPSTPPRTHVSVFSATTPEEPPRKMEGQTWSDVKREYQEARGKQGPRTAFALLNQEGTHLASPEKAINGKEAVFVELSKLVPPEKELLHSGLLYSLRHSAGISHVGYEDLSERIRYFKPKLRQLSLLDASVLIDLAQGGTLSHMICGDKKDSVLFVVTETAWEEVVSIPQQNMLRDIIFPEYTILLIDTKVDKNAVEDCYRSVCRYLGLLGSDWMNENRNDFRISFEACLVRKALGKDVVTRIVSSNLKFCSLLQERGVNSLECFREMGIYEFPKKLSAADVWNAWYRSFPTESACNKCAGTGHHIKYCPSPTDALFRHPQPVCTACYGFGHPSTYCPTKTVLCTFCFGLGHTSRCCTTADLPKRNYSIM